MVIPKISGRKVKGLAGVLSIFFLFFFINGPTAAHGSPDNALENPSQARGAVGEGSAYLGDWQSCNSPKVRIADNAVRAGLLYDMASGRIIWQKNMNQAYPIASLTKMMVVLLAMEDIRAGKTRWNTMVSVAPEATRVGGFTVALRAGRPLSVEDLMKAALISSGNDAAYQLALFLGKTEKNFVGRMNRRAAELGMASTRYSNPTGMPARRSADDNRSSASDLLLLCKEIYKYKDLMRIAGTAEDVIYQGGRVIKLKNHNHLVAGFNEVDGFKTGYTCNAKFCLAATASKEGRRVISIALGVDSRHLRDQFVKNLFCRYYDAIGMGPLETKSGRAIAKNVSKKKESAYQAASGPAVYRIRKGDTLSGIASAHRCSVSQLKSWNGLRGNSIVPGRKLKIYGKSGNMQASAKRQKTSSVIYYKVKPGDTLWRISQKYDGLTVEKLMKTNNIREAMDLKTGDTIKIHLDRSARYGKVL